MKYIALIFLTILLIDQAPVFAGHHKKTKPVRFLLITGCARSGTVYITQVLNHCGLKMRHENEGQDGIVSWLMAAESDKAPWGPGGNKFRFLHIFHQVRHPLKAIASICTEPPKAWQYTCTYIPQININEPLLIRAAKYYYYWNLMAEKKAEWTYRIEDLKNVFREFSSRLGKKLDKKALDKVPKNANTRGPTMNLTWEDLKAVLDSDLYENLIQMTMRYGYSVEGAF